MNSIHKNQPGENHAGLSRQEAVKKIQTIVKKVERVSSARLLRRGHPPAPDP